MTQLCPVKGCAKKHTIKTHREQSRIAQKPRCVRGCDRQQKTAKSGLCTACYTREMDTVQDSRLRIYGITKADYDSLLASQGGVCAICGLQNELSRHGTPKTLGVDHDHDTGKVRGLLCSPCNVGLGNFRDDIERLKQAITYLERG